MVSIMVYLSFKRFFPFIYKNNNQIILLVWNFGPSVTFLVYIFFIHIHQNTFHTLRFMITFQTLFLSNVTALTNDCPPTFKNICAFTRPTLLGINKNFTFYSKKQATQRKENLFSCDECKYMENNLASNFI